MGMWHQGSWVGSLGRPPVLGAHSQEDASLLLERLPVPTTGPQQTRTTAGVQPRSPSRRRHRPRSSKSRQGAAARATRPRRHQTARRRPAAARRRQRHQRRRKKRRLPPRIATASQRQQHAAPMRMSRRGATAAGARAASRRRPASLLPRSGQLPASRTATMSRWWRLASARCWQTGRTTSERSYCVHRRQHCLDLTRAS